MATKAETKELDEVMEKVRTGQGVPSGYVYNPTWDPPLRKTADAPDNAVIPTPANAAPEQEG